MSGYSYHLTDARLNRAVPGRPRERSYGCQVTGVSTSRSRRRNRRGEGSQLRADIVTAARELIEESGSAEAVTLRAVARRVGIAAQSIYGHFPGPEQIVRAVVAQG